MRVHPLAWFALGVAVGAAVAAVRAPRWKPGPSRFANGFEDGGCNVPRRPRPDLLGPASSAERWNPHFFRTQAQL